MMHSTCWSRVSLRSGDTQFKQLCVKLVKSDCLVHALTSRFFMIHANYTQNWTNETIPQTITTTLNLEPKVHVIVIVINVLYPTWSTKNNLKKQPSTTVTVVVREQPFVDYLFQSHQCTLIVIMTHRVMFVFFVFFSVFLMWRKMYESLWISYCYNIAKL